MKIRYHVSFSLDVKMEWYGEGDTVEDVKRIEENAVLDDPPSLGDLISGGVGDLTVLVEVIGGDDGEND